MAEAVAGECIAELLMRGAAGDIEEGAKGRTQFGQIHSSLDSSTGSFADAERYRYAVARLIPKALASS